MSEGPDFALLAARGYRIFTIYHVDVVAYVAAIYGRGLIRPETTVRWYRRVKSLASAISPGSCGKSRRRAFDIRAA